MATLAELQEDLAKYKAARDRILEGGQASGTGGANVTRANLETIEKRIENLEARIALAKKGAGPVSFGVNALFGRRS